MRTTVVIASFALLVGCSAVPLPRRAPPPPAPPPMCVQYDTSDVLVNYPTTGPRQQLVDDLVRKVDKELHGYLAEAKIPTVPAPCQPDVDSVMTMRIDRIEAVSDKKFSLVDPWATAIEARMKYRVTFAAPNARPFFDVDGLYQYESLDDLASKLAHRLYDLGVVRYPKSSRTGSTKRPS
jgi:hypothetical protein